MTTRSVELEKQLGNFTASAKDEASFSGLNACHLASIGRILARQWATYWAVDPQKIRLHAAEIWNEAGSGSRLTVNTMQRQLSLSEGCAGHVWRSKKPIWTTNIALDMCLPRSTEAMDIGMRGGIWFAVKTDAAVYGVAEFLGHQLEAASDELLLAIEQFGTSLGRLVERNQS